MHDLQVFQHGHTEPLGDVERNPVVEVAADARGAGLEAGDTSALLGIAARVPLAASKSVLSPSLSTFEPFQAGGHGQHFACRQRERVDHAPVDANGGTEGPRDLVLDLTSEGDVPALSPRAPP